MNHLRGALRTFLTTGFVVSLLLINFIIFPGSGQKDEPITEFRQGYDVIVTLDQNSYYLGETVHVSVQLLVDGIPYANGGACPTVLDPEGEWVYGGLCFPTNEWGYANFSFTLWEWYLLGTYNMTIMAEFEPPVVVTVYHDFDVVSSVLVVDAHGPYEGFVGVPIQFTGTVEGGKSPYTWSWDFGDSTTSSLQNPTHSYQETGSFPVTLTVWDSGTATGSDETVALIYGPQVEYFLYVLTDASDYYPGDIVHVTGRLTEDGSGVSSTLISLQILNPSQQIIVDESTMTNATGYYDYAYELEPTAALGTYTVTASVTIQTTYLEDSTQFDVIPIMMVVDAGGPYQGIVGNAIQFHGSVTGGFEPYTWAWDFGDQAQGEGQNPNHVYTTAGTYTVTLTVTDAYDNTGVDTASAVVSSTSGFTHTVLVEYGTATTCVPCVTASGQLYEIYSSHEYEFFYVTMVTDTNTKAEQRFHELAPSPYAVPDVYFDGGYLSILGKQDTTGPYINAIRDSGARTVANIDMALTATWNDDESKYDMSLVLTNHDPSVYNGVVRIYIVEPISRWDNEEGEPYHFGLLDYIQESVSVESTKTLTKTWNADSAGFSDISSGNIKIIAAVFRQGNGYVDDVVSTSTGSGFSIEITKPSAGLFIRNNQLFRFLFREKPVILGPIEVETEVVESSASIEKVEFYVNGVLKSTDTSKPYGFTWTAKSPLIVRYTIKAKAIGSGDRVASDEVIVWRFR